MNLLLLEPGEVDGSGGAQVRGRRADHLRTVLKVAPGMRLRAGLLDGPLGSAEVLAAGPDGVRLQCTFDREAPAAGDVLLLAVPRPKVLLRMLEHAAALGFGRILLLRTWRVEHGHLHSRALAPELQRPHLLAGLEQAGRTRLPAVRFRPRFKPFVEDELDQLRLPASRFCAHPTAERSTASLELAAGAPFALALGPDGGWLPYEVELLAGHGFLPVSCGELPLRTETALAVLTGQLDLLRRRG